MIYLPELLRRPEYKSPYPSKRFEVAFLFKAKVRVQVIAGDGWEAELAATEKAIEMARNVLKVEEAMTQELPGQIEDQPK